MMKGGEFLVKNEYYRQNGGHLSKTPPKHLGTLAKVCWRKIVPFLESTDRVSRIDSALVELYCSQYEIYRSAYDDVKKNGIQSPLFKTLQNSAGELVGKDFIGYRKNPAVSIMKDSSSQLTNIGSQLGLSPKARAELMEIVSEKNSASAGDEIAKFFKGE